jgi:hypothetical protein
VVLIGLVSYALWGLVRALLDPLHKGKDLKGIAERVGFLFSTAAYALLVFPPMLQLPEEENKRTMAPKPSKRRNMSLSFFR